MKTVVSWDNRLKYLGQFLNINYEVFSLHDTLKNNSVCG